MLSRICVVFFFFFKQKTAYEMRISDWSSDVCSSDLPKYRFALLNIFSSVALKNYPCLLPTSLRCQDNYFVSIRQTAAPTAASSPSETNISMRVPSHGASTSDVTFRSEEHTSELQSLMRLSYAVFCLKKKKKQQQ